MRRASHVRGCGPDTPSVATAQKMENGWRAGAVWAWGKLGKGLESGTVSQSLA